MVKKLQKLDKQSGFTLVEVLIVVIILGIVSSIVMISVAGAMASGTKRACEAEYEAVRSAWSAFKSDNPNGTIANTNLYATPPAVVGPSDVSLQSLNYLSTLRSNGKYRIQITTSGVLSVAKTTFQSGVEVLIPGSDSPTCPTF